jgi:uncharacterized protein YecT (DUF1311 family)
MSHMINHVVASMRRQSLGLLATVLLGPAMATAAVYPNVSPAGKNLPRKAEWYQQCMRVRPLQPPPKDLPRSAEPERCDAADLFYDTQNMAAPTDADWKKVRDCAFRTNASGVLMMLYANGSGVYPNLNLATRYACSIESPAAEMQGRVAHLRRRMAGAERGDVDVCDDVASSDMRGVCASVRERQREKRRNDQLAAIARRWTPKEQLGLEMASKAMHYFAQHRFDYETDQGSTAKRALQVETMGAELDQFVSDIEEFEKGNVPTYSEAEFASLEAKMNQTYQQFIQTRPASTSYLGTIRKSGVEKTQRAWLAYRDAMELFGSIKYPSTPASGWRALLTSRRLKQLSELDDASAGR